MKAQLVVFGREPVPGRVKSRLAADVGAERAAAVYAVLLDHTLAEAASSGLETVLALAGAPSAMWRHGLRVPTELQTGAELGSRMAAAFRRRFDGGAERVVLVGSDCPGLQAAHLRRAAAAVAEVPAVLGPAADGGYWLVAQRRPGLDLFTGIPWSAPSTLESTRRRLEGLGVSWLELEPLADIDTEADLLAALDDDAVSESVRGRLRSIVRRSAP